MTKAASGQWALHIPRVTGRSMIINTGLKQTGITNKLYGRMRVFLEGGASNSHTALVFAMDAQDHRWELGMQSGAWHGNWHVSRGSGSEVWMNSSTKPPSAQWVCLEWLFDGSAAKNLVTIWSDGNPVMYLSGGAGVGNRDIITEAQGGFVEVQIGFFKSNSSNIGALKELWIDDVAIGPDRIGCM